MHRGPKASTVASVASFQAGLKRVMCGRCCRRTNSPRMHGAQKSSALHRMCACARKLPHCTDMICTTRAYAQPSRCGFGANLSCIAFTPHGCGAAAVLNYASTLNRLTHVQVSPRTCQAKPYFAQPNVLASLAGECCAAAVCARSRGHRASQCRYRPIGASVCCAHDARTRARMHTCTLARTLARTPTRAHARTHARGAAVGLPGRSTGAFSPAGSAPPLRLGPSCVRRCALPCR